MSKFSLETVQENKTFFPLASFYQRHFVVLSVFYKQNYKHPNKVADNI